MYFVQLLSQNSYDKIQNPKYIANKQYCADRNALPLIIAILPLREQRSKLTIYLHRNNLKLNLSILIVNLIEYIQLGLWNIHVKS